MKLNLCENKLLHIQNLTLTQSGQGWCFFTRHRPLGRPGLVTQTSLSLSIFKNILLH